MSDTEEDKIKSSVKITLVGESATGKSSLCGRFRGAAAGAGGTAGAELSAAQWAGATLHLCDVSGAALSSTMLNNYLYDSDIVIFVYDITNLQSFEKLIVWINTIKDILETEQKRPLLALFGNKSDLEHQRAVRLSCVQKLASEYLLENFKGSARTGEMVNLAFTNLIARVIDIKPPLKVSSHRSDPDNEVYDQIDTFLPMQDPATSLIMNRKMLRKVQRKASSSVCLIEKYTENVRFCMICNYLGKIIPALQSRCTRFRFAPLQESQILPRLREIAEKENVTMTEDGAQALLALAGGDMRRVLNTLQSTWLASRRVSEDSVYACVGHPLRSDINYIMQCLLNENDFGACFQQIQDLKITKGLALGDILTEVHSIIQRVNFPPDVLISLLIKMADSEARLASGCSERIELAALISAFQMCKDQINVEALTS